MPPKLSLNITFDFEICIIEAQINNVVYLYETDKYTCEKILTIRQYSIGKAVKELSKIKKFTRLYSIPKVGDRIFIGGEHVTINHIQMIKSSPYEKVPFIEVEEILDTSFNWQKLEQSQKNHRR